MDQGHAIELSPLFECAHRFSTSWNYESVRKALERLASSNSGAQIDWEKGDEQWGRVLVGNEVVAFVCAKLPLVAVHSKLSGIASGWAGNQDGAEVIVMDDFEAADFSVDRSLLERIFGREISSNLDYNAISISELWWATVT